ncbi:intercellular adhesion molecule 5-like [Rana temporaria]|uniref:intercellular adhesion molecule 5-like n=1 Tax=Rana temporaria TaxID=8407 RepID=UPI001AAC593D|nr:intercellular adhesion molecule 5-like [Rana temporaria]
MGIDRILLAVFHVTALIHSGNSQSCTVHIEKENDFVPFGDTAVLNCTSNCTSLSWETRLTKLQVSPDRTSNFSWVKVKVSEWEDSPIQCLASDDDTAVANVIPYVLPSGLDIDLKRELEEDEEHEVTCSVYGVAPVQYVILSVTRGGETLFRRTYEKDPRKVPQNLKETFKFNATRRDNLQDFACQVTLNLTNVPNTTVQSSPVTVRTYALPEDPRITAEMWLEKGTVTTISCEVPRAFPPDNIITVLSVDGFPNASVAGNVSVSFNLDTNELPAARHNLLCLSQVFQASKQSNMHIHIYEPPMVNLTVSSKVANLGDTVTADCNLIRGNSEYFGLSISVDGEKGKREESPDLTEIIIITRRKPNLTVTCKIFIRDNNKELLTKEETLTVQYPPEFSDSSCPDSIVWVEGKESMFGCRSEGNPTPEERCTFNLENVTLQTTATFSAERNMSGTYTCQASNLIGTVNKSVEVTVQYPPECPTVQISTQSSVSAGDSVNLTCHSDALPSPTYSWDIPPQAQVVFSQENRFLTIKEASSYHSGKYTCNVENKHGHLSIHQDLEVKSDNTILVATLSSIAGVAGLVAIVYLVRHFFCQNGKKGFYDLVKRTPKKPNPEVPLQEKELV